MEQTVVVYQAYGNTDVLNEARYSILSFLIHHRNVSDCSIVVYTDQPSFFSDLSFGAIGVKVRPMYEMEIRRWKGPYKFVHRVKIEMLRDVCNTFSGNIFYLDSDTYVRGSLLDSFKAINNGQFVMHVLEYYFATHRGKQLGRFRRHLKRNREKHNLSFDFEFWNAGVIGFNTRFRSLLEDVLQITDTIYAFHPKHIVEQMAFSNVLYNANKVIFPSDQYIYHYWKFKEFRKVLGEFFAINDGKGANELLDRVASLDPLRLHQPKLEWEKHSSLYRWFAQRLTGRTWEMPPCELRAGVVPSSSVESARTEVGR